MIQLLACKMVDLHYKYVIDYPRHTSKILANVKKEDNRAEKRA